MIPAKAQNLGDFHTNSNLGGGQFGLQGGIMLTRRSRWLSSFRIGLDALHTFSNIQVGGRWSLDLFPPANRYRYRYGVNIASMGPTLALDLYKKAHSVLFVGAGFGVDKISSHGFTTTPLGNADVSDFRFIGGSKTNLYYKASIGYRYLLAHGSVSVAYQYQHLGDSYTGAGKTITGLSTPGLKDPIHSNGVTIAYSYTF